MECNLKKIDILFLDVEMEEKNVLLGVPNSENDPVHHPSYYCDGGMECIECGSCAYTCPASVPLVLGFRVAKQVIRNASAPVKK